MFPFFDDGRHAVAIVRLDLAGGNEDADEFINCLPAIGGPQFGNDVFLTQNIGQTHETSLRGRNVFVQRKPALQTSGPVYVSFDRQTSFHTFGGKNFLSALCKIPERTALRPCASCKPFSGRSRRQSCWCWPFI